MNRARQMQIGLHDADAEHLKNKTFPNYALMKISAWHKAKGNTVSWWNPLERERFGMVYSSKVFDFTSECRYLPHDAIKGGTGYDVKPKLPQEIDECKPDYSIYPSCDYAIGFLTRGCPNNCRWCIVPEKEGRVKPYRKWQELARHDSKKLVLMDNNILASGHGLTELESLATSGYEIDINQGMDARLFDGRVADICASINWIKYIRFSCDTKAQISPLIKAINLLGARGIKPYRIFIYLLVTGDIADAEARVTNLKRYKAINLYAQAERNAGKGIVPSPIQLEFAQRYVYKGLYRNENWQEYCEKRGIDSAVA